MNKTIIVVILVILAALGLYWFMSGSTQTVRAPEPTTNTAPAPTATTTVTQPATSGPTTVIGQSVGGKDIVAYNYGSGATRLLFVSGIHGGYEWNTVLVAHQLMDYLKDNPSVVPSNVTVSVIPVLNPDGLAKVAKLDANGRFTAANVSSDSAVLTSGRFNGNNVDLNRNFDCDWQAQGKWQTKTVSGGTAAFSEPESAAIKSYIQSNKPAAVVAFYSAAGGVFASSCHNGVLPETNKLTQTYAKASGYKAYQDFNFYEITGDMVNWLAKQNIPAISVLLTDHNSTEWSKNKAGIEAVLKSYATPTTTTSGTNLQTN